MFKRRLALLLLLFIYASNILAQHDHNMDMTSMPMMPVMAKSNEATKEQLAFAKAEGDSVTDCINWLLQQKNIASGQVNAGEYKITYIFSKPEGWYDLNNEILSWHQPSANDDAHLWLFVQDGADGRIVPPLSISYIIQNAQSKTTDANAITYAWMPMVNGYGNNIKLSGNGDYILNIDVSPMPYRRHDPYNGDRFTAHTKASATININPSNFNTVALSKLMEDHQQLSKDAGIAYHNTLMQMYKQANDGRDTITGDYRVAFAVEYAEGYWHYENDKFRYMQENDMSGKTNAHIEIAVLDAGTGRFMDKLEVTAVLKTDDGKTIGEKNEPFMWHPWLYHYGENWRIPKSGKYVIVAEVKPPSYRRYGKISGNQFAKPFSVAFNNVTLKSGQK